MERVLLNHGNASEVRTNTFFYSELYILEICRSIELFFLSFFIKSEKDAKLARQQVMQCNQKRKTCFTSTLYAM